MTARDTAARCMRDQIGKPYQWGTHGPRTFDCSGLTSYCAGKAGYTISPSSHEQWKLGESVGLRDVEPGDLLFYTAGTGADHVGMVVDDTMAVHALNPDLGIREVPIDSQNLGVRFMGARSIFPADDRRPPPERWKGLPEWLSADALRAAFPLADPEGEVTKLAMAWAANAGKVPWFIGKVDLGGGRNLWRFEHFTVLSDGDRVQMEGERR